MYDNDYNIIICITAYVLTLVRFHYNDIDNNHSYHNIPGAVKKVAAKQSRINPNQNTPGVKKVAAKNLKKGCAEKDVKSKWATKASCYDGI